MESLSRPTFLANYLNPALNAWQVEMTQPYYGFKGMLLTTDDGIIEQVALVAANLDERDALVDLDLHRIAGKLLGDPQKTKKHSKWHGSCWERVLAQK